MATPTFHCFSSLPSEIQEMVWQYASGGDGYNHTGPPRTIEVLLLPTNAQWVSPTEVEHDKPSLSRLRINFRLIEGSRANGNLNSPKNAHPLSQSSHHSREVFLRHNPDQLRLIDLANPQRSGQVIRFNARRDTVFLDLESLYYLRQYMGYLKANMLALPGLLCGFDRIRSLSRPLGSTLELALDVMYLLDGGPQKKEQPILPLVKRMHINENVPHSVRDIKMLSRRLYLALSELWHWSLSLEQRDHLNSELHHVLRLGGSSSLGPQGIYGLASSRVPAERGSTSRGSTSREDEAD